MLGSNLADNLVAMGFIIDTGIFQQRRNQVELAIAPLALAVGDVLGQNENRVCFGDVYKRQLIGANKMQPAGSRNSTGWLYVSRDISYFINDIS